MTRTSHVLIPNGVQYVSTLILTLTLNSLSPNQVQPSPIKKKKNPYLSFSFSTNGIIHHFSSGQGLIFRNHPLHISFFTNVQVIFDRAVIIVTSYITNRFGPPTHTPNFTDMA